MTIDLSRRAKPQQYTAIISNKQQLTAHVWLVTFSLQSPDTLAFLPGQTLSLHVADGVNRSMSICSSPSDAHTIQMVHDVSPMGPGSRWTLERNIGDQATFMAPLGVFLLDPTPRKKVFVATGTGIAPYHAMLLDIFSNSELSARNLEFALYWGMRYETDVYWAREFADMVAAHQNFSFYLTLSQPSDSWTGLRGRVTDHVLQTETKPADYEYYLCGSREMVRDMEDLLSKAGVPKAQVYKELYY